MGGEHGEGRFLAQFGMLGIVYVLTRGGLTLYNETDAASEVSWIIVPAK